MNCYSCGNTGKITTGFWFWKKTIICYCVKIREIEDRIKYGKLPEFKWEPKRS